VLRGDVPDGRDEAVVRVDGIESPHDTVAHDLRDDRRGGDRGAASVAVDDSTVRGRRRPESEAVDQTGVGWRVQIPEDGTKPSEVRAMEPDAVDRAGRHDPHADSRRARADGFEEHLALLDRHLLRVVQQRERPYARAAQRLVVEEHAGNDERPSERSASRLVCTRNEAHTELAIESEEALAGGSSHAAERTS